MYIDYQMNYWILRHGSDENDHVFPTDHMANALAPNSGCEPKPVEVPMPLDPDPYVLTWPTCTPVPRCGGCCGNPMLECAPTAVEDKHLKVELYDDFLSRNPCLICLRINGM